MGRATKPRGCSRLGVQPANPLMARRTAERPKYCQLHIEPLEDRKLLATLYYNDDWTNETTPGVAPVAGNLVGHPTDFGTVSGLVYGTDAFGLETTSGAGGLPNIKDAIDAAADNDTVFVGTGTHVQSDIVIDKPLSLLGEGEGSTVIVPEVASANSTGDFPAATHSGIIIQMDPAHVWDAGAGDGVTVMDLTVDGGAGSFSDLDFHHGITTLYETPAGSTVRNGTLSSTQWGAPSASYGAGVTEPNIQIDSVTVRNTYWHGITVSPKENQGYDAGEPNEHLALNVFNSTVENVGSTKDADRIGILMQNIGDAQVGTLGNLVNNTISNVGVGTKLAPFGTLAGELGNILGANNNAMQTLQHVDNAAVYAFWIKDSREDDNTILTASQTGGPQAGSVGIFLDHSRADDMTGSVITGYDIGVLVRNTKFGAGSGVPGAAGTAIAPYGTVIDLVGPGTGVSGSVGLLVEGDATNEAVFGLGPAATISGFEIGVLVTNHNGNTDQSVLSVDRPQVSGNGTDIFVGDNSLLIGSVDINSNITVTGTGTINPRTTNQFNPNNDASDFWDGSTSFVAVPPPVPLPDKAATAAATDITLGSSATFRPILTGEDAAPGVRWDFNNKVGATGEYPSATLPPLNIDGSLVDPQTPYGALTVWGGQVTQDGTGALVLGGTATVGSGLGYLYGTDASVDPNNASVYLIEPEDHTERTYMNVALKLDPANEAKIILFGLSDRRANSEMWIIPTNILNTSSYTTVSINLMAPSIELTENSSGASDDVGLDYSNIGGYVFGGDQGAVNGNQQVPLRFSVDEVSFTDQKNSMLEVSGSIDLGGATLDAEIRSGLVLGFGQEFTIVNNTGGSPVTGTFAGLAEGATLTIGGDFFTISYSAGDGNDVVLTSPVIDPAVTGRFMFYNNSKWDGNTPGIGAGDSAAIPGSKATYLPGSGTITSASMSSFSRGINGIFVDISSTHGALSLADFGFNVSNPGAGVAGANNTPSTWSAAPAPIAFTVLSDTPSAGTDRIEFIWADNAIDNQYLEVRTFGADDGNANTGLAATDVFYFGHNRGDTFNDVAPTVWLTTGADETAIQASPIISVATIDGLFDIDRNGIHLASDRIAARANTINALNKINISNPPAAPAPPGGDNDGAGSAVASALAIPSSSRSLDDQAWVATRLAESRSEGLATRTLFQQPVEAVDPRASELTQATDAAVDRLRLDDDLLESLLSDLGGRSL